MSRNTGNDLFVIFKIILFSCLIIGLMVIGFYYLRFSNTVQTPVINSSMYYDEEQLGITNQWIKSRQIRQLLATYGITIYHDDLSKIQWHKHPIVWIKYIFRCYRLTNIRLSYKSNEELARRIYTYQKYYWSDYIELSRYGCKTDRPEIYPEPQYLSKENISKTDWVEDIAQQNFWIGLVLGLLVPMLVPALLITWLVQRKDHYADVLRHQHKQEINKIINSNQHFKRLLIAEIKEKDKIIADLNQKLFRVIVNRPTKRPNRHRQIRAQFHNFRSSA